MELVEEIKGVLEANEFAKKTENIWERETQIKQQGHTMIINGQRIQQPDQIIDLKYKVELCGSGCLENEDGSNHQDFEMVCIQVIQGDEIIQEFNDSIYNIDEFVTRFFNK